MRTLLLCLTIVSSGICSAQEISFQYLKGDSLPFSDGFDCGRNMDTVVIENDSLFGVWKNSCNWEFKAPDFSKFIILGATYGGDCMMHIEPHIYRDSTSKTITLSTRNYWGGCRAAGWRQIWIVVEKPPANYSLRFEEIQIDDRN